MQTFDITIKFTDFTSAMPLNGATFTKTITADVNVISPSKFIKRIKRFIGEIKRTPQHTDLLDVVDIRYIEVIDLWQPFSPVTGRAEDAVPICSSATNMSLVEYLRLRASCTQSNVPDIRAEGRGFFYIRPSDIVDTVPMNCVTCVNNTRSVMLLPCRHLVICSECANHLFTSMPHKCPVCGDDILNAYTALF